MKKPPSIINLDMYEAGDKNEAIKMEKALEKALKESTRPDIFHFYKIYKHWKVIIGEPLYTKTAPFKLDRKVLHILVEDAAYSSHLRFFETAILDLIASPEICGEGVVNKVVFRVGELPRRAEKKPEPPPESKKTASQPPSSKLVRQTEEVCRKIKDPELKKIFGRYMLRTISREKSDDEK